MKVAAQQNFRDRRYCEYSRTSSGFSDNVLNRKKLFGSTFLTRSGRKAGWELYKKVFPTWGRYFSDGSSHKATYQCLPTFADVVRPIYSVIAGPLVPGLIHHVFQDSAVTNLAMQIEEVGVLSEQVVECIVYNDLSSKTTFVEDRKRRVENRARRLIENIVDVQDYGTHLMLTTQPTSLERPYAYGRFEAVFGELADQEIADALFRKCYKVPKYAVSNVYVFTGGQRHRYQVV